MHLALPSTLFAGTSEEVRVRWPQHVAIGSESYFCLRGPSR